MEKNDGPSHTMTKKSSSKLFAQVEITGTETTEKASDIAIKEAAETKRDVTAHKIKDEITSIKNKSVTKQQ